MVAGEAEIQPMADKAEIKPMADEAEIQPMAKTEIKKPFEFDYERAKKTIKRVLGEYLNDDEITKVMSHFMTKYDDIKNAQDILYYLTNELIDLPTIGIDNTKREDIHNAYSKYKNTPEYTADWEKDLEYEKKFGILPYGVGGARIRRTRKSAVKRRKSSRRSTKQRKSSRRQLPLRRRRTNKK